jgi:hypothetical protein
MNAEPARTPSPATPRQGLNGMARTFCALEARIDQLQNDKLAQRAPQAWRAAWLEEVDTLVERQYALLALAVATPALHADAIAAKMQLLEAFAAAHKPDFAELSGTRLDLMGSIARDLARLGARR